VGYAEWDDEFLDMRMLLVESLSTLRGYAIIFSCLYQNSLNEDVV
jgi:hypothetical protein